MERDLAREGLRRLKPLRQLATSLLPDPGSDMGRVCALESCHYMRNQLLRDADWAGMAHSIEVRTPLVDINLLKSLAPLIAKLTPGAGKLALAQAPSTPLPDAIMSRAKTGFSVPTGAWMSAVAHPAPSSDAVAEPKGLISRRWSRVVLAGAENLGREAHA
jgi:asparagine synthase (glutamine-hydrolysing)